jgi:cation transport ATPase
MAHRTRVVVFDKTGTLTQARAAVTHFSVHAPADQAVMQHTYSVDGRGGIDGAQQQQQQQQQPLAMGSSPVSVKLQEGGWDVPRVLRMLCAVEGHSDHPLARAIHEYANTMLQQPESALAVGQAAGTHVLAATPYCHTTTVRTTASTITTASRLFALLLPPTGCEVSDFEAVPGRGLKCR